MLGQSTSHLQPVSVVHHKTPPAQQFCRPDLGKNQADLAAGIRTAGTASSPCAYAWARCRSLQPAAVLLICRAPNTTYPS